MKVALWTTAASLVTRSPSFLLRMSTSQSNNMSTSTDTKTKKPFAVIVQAEIQPNRMDEFLTMIAFNAAESRKEPGCLRFGTL
jgi:hypothetical protein